MARPADSLQGVSPVSDQYILLHCPTGHLSAAVAGIAVGDLPLHNPSRQSLRAFFARSLQRRRYGEISQVPDATATGSGSAPLRRPFLVMGRGNAGWVIDTALGQFARITAGRLEVRAGPALRLDRSPAGVGGLPAPIMDEPAPARLRIALCVARAAICLGWDRLADWAGSIAVTDCYGALVQRARFLPAAATRQNDDAYANLGADHKSEANPEPPVPRAVYHCFGATHSSLVAASLHTGVLPAVGPLPTAAICRVPGFDARASSDIGRAVFMGEDQDGWPVFVIGFDGARTVLTRAFIEILRLMPPDGAPVVLTDTLSWVSPLVKVGGYLSRRLRIIALGRRIAASGISHSAHNLRAVVADTRRQMRLRHQARVAGVPEGSA